MNLGAPAHALTWSPTGVLLIAGIGSGGRAGKDAAGTKDGAFMVLNARNLEVVHEGRDSKHWVRCLRFSPDGTLLALGSEDNNIYVYDATAGFVAKDYTCSKHNAPLRAIDFSTDNQFVRSNCNAYECLFYSAQDGEHIEQGGTRFRDVPWATESCVLTWACQGVGTLWCKLEYWQVLR